MFAAFAQANTAHIVSEKANIVILGCIQPGWNKYISLHTGHFRVAMKWSSDRPFLPYCDVHASVTEKNGDLVLCISCWMDFEI